MERSGAQWSAGQSIDGLIPPAAISLKLWQFRLLPDSRRMRARAYVCAFVRAHIVMTRGKFNSRNESADQSVASLTSTNVCVHCPLTAC